MGDYFTSCSGRLGDIGDDVYLEFNSENQAGTAASPLGDAIITSWINRCIKDIAERGYFKKTTSLNITNGVYSYDLSSLISDYVRIRQCWRVNSATDMIEINPFRTRAAYEEATTSSVTNNDDYYWFWMEGATLLLWPTPTADVTSGLKVYHDYLPSDLSSGRSYFDAAAAVDVGGGLVDIPATNHGFSVGDSLTVYGTTNYNGAQTVATGTDPNTIRITDTYVAETFATTDYAQSAGNTTPPTPVIHDLMYVYFCLKEAYSKDRLGDNADARYAKYNGLYLRERGKLVHGKTNERITMGFPR